MRGKFGVEADIAIPSYYIKDIVLQSFQLPSILQHLTLKIAKIKQEIENHLNTLLFLHEREYNINIKIDEKPYKRSLD